MVYGAELEYSMGDYDNGAFAGDVSALDLKARLGYSFGSAMVYGFAGGTFAEVDNGGTISEFAGLNYGAGAAYQFNSGMFLGLEYMVRDLDGSGAVDGQVLTVDAVTARVGWQF